MLGAVLKSLLVMYFSPPLLVMTAETMYPRSSAMMTCTYTQAGYCQHPSSIACWSAELLFALINMLTRLWQMPVSVMGLDFATWSEFAIWLMLQCSLELCTSCSSSDPVSWHYYPSATGCDELLVHTALAKDLLTVTQVQVSVPQEVS